MNQCFIFAKFQNYLKNFKQFTMDYHFTEEEVHLEREKFIELKRENPQLTSDRKRLYEICDLSTSFFEKQKREK